MNDKFYMKLGKLRIEQSEKEKALNFGLEGKEAEGFFTLPLSARGVLRAAGALGVSLAVRRVKKKLHLTENRKKDAQRRQENALPKHDFGSRRGLGGGKRK